MVIDKLPSLEEFERLYGDAIGDTDLQAAYEAVQHSIMEENRHKAWVAKVEREAEERGIERGVAEGLEKGIEQGIEQGKAELVDRLRALGVDEDVLQRALADSE